MSGRLLGIARKSVRRGPIERLDSVRITPERGVEGDRIGASATRRKVTILRAEDWADACRDVGVALDWTARRANLLVEGLPSFEDGIGRRLRIGSAVLEINGETEPCSRMFEAHIGLPDALTPHWRGGACCHVVMAGCVSLGDEAGFL